MDMPIWHAVPRRSPTTPTPTFPWDNDAYVARCAVTRAFADGLLLFFAAPYDDSSALASVFSPAVSSMETKVISFGVCLILLLRDRWR